MNMESLNSADIEFILWNKDPTAVSSSEVLKERRKWQNRKHTPGNALKSKPQAKICRELKLHLSLLKPSLNQSHEHRHSQEGRRAKPGRNWLDGFPFLILDKAQEVVLGASSLVLPEDAVLTAERITDGLSL